MGETNTVIERMEAKRDGPSSMMKFSTDEEFARRLDAEDSLRRSPENASTFPWLGTANHSSTLSETRSA